MRILLVGFGSVGKSLALMLEARRDDLYANLGLTPLLVGVADSSGAAVDAGGLSAQSLQAAKSSAGSVAGHAKGRRFDQAFTPAQLVRDTLADIVIEASPSVLANPGPAFENLKAALSTGKHAISVNKAPLAVAMPALLDLAGFNRVQLRFSGAVGAGTPVLATARTLAAGDRLLAIRGILNGTTNFILWRMLENSDTYPAALAEAIRLGYAETDPSADVDGLDTASKVVILANAVLGLGMTIGDLKIVGIRDIQRSAIEAAASTGQSIKLIGEVDVATRRARVTPQPVARFGPMDVPDNLNAVEFTLESAGKVTLVGRGAGGPQTATAIVRDLVDIWNSTEHNHPGRVPFQPG